MASESSDAVARACYRSLSRVRGAELIEDGGLFGVRTGIPLTSFNGVALTRLKTRNAEKTIVRTIRTFQSKRQPFHWRLSPADTPAGVASVLQAHGLRHGFSSTGMTAELCTLPLDAVPSADVSIRPALTAREREMWGDVFAAGFELPPAQLAIWLDVFTQCAADWVHFVAYEQDVPVAVASLLLAGELAGIYYVVTLPDVRGRGIGTAITTAALRHARAAGATTAALEATTMGLRVYRSLGFAACGALRLYGWRPAA